MCQKPLTFVAGKHFTRGVRRSFSPLDLQELHLLSCAGLLEVQVFALREQIFRLLEPLHAIIQSLLAEWHISQREQPSRSRTWSDRTAVRPVNSIESSQVYPRTYAGESDRIRANEYNCTGNTENRVYPQGFCSSRSGIAELWSYQRDRLGGGDVTHRVSTML